MTYTPTPAGHTVAPQEQTVTSESHPRIERMIETYERCAADAMREGISLIMAVNAYVTLGYFKIPDVRMEEITSTMLVLHDTHPSFREECGEFGKAGYVFAALSAHVPVVTYSLPFPLRGVFHNHCRGVRILDAPVLGNFADYTRDCLFINRTQHGTPGVLLDVPEENLFVNLGHLPDAGCWPICPIIDYGTHDEPEASRMNLVAQLLDVRSHVHINRTSSETPHFPGKTWVRERFDVVPEMHAFFDELMNYCRHDPNGMPKRYGANVAGQIRLALRSFDKQYQQRKMDLMGWREVIV